MVSTDGDAGAFRVGLLGADFTDNLDVCDFFVSVYRDVLILDYMEGLSAINALVLSVQAGANPLAEVNQLVGVGLVPFVLVPRVVA